MQDQAIREGLKQYTIAGVDGAFARRSGGWAFALGFYGVRDRGVAQPRREIRAAGLLYLFRRIERSLHGQPAAIVLDEAWIMLGHETFRGKIREWLKVMRKANCLILMATQSLTDAASSGILDVIMESTATKIFLPNAYARDEDANAPLPTDGSERAPDRLDLRGDS